LRGLRSEKLRRLPVRLRGILLGRPTDLILHPSAPRLLGLEVLCGDQNVRFLPSSTAVLREQEIEVGSPFVLLELPSDSLYRSDARPLSSLIGMPFGEDGAVFRDLVLGPGWTIQEVVLEDGCGERRVPVGGALLKKPVTRSARRRPRSKRRPV
jgi:hypothetical protein